MRFTRLFDGHPRARVVLLLAGSLIHSDDACAAFAASHLGLRCTWLVAVVRLVARLRVFKASAAIRTILWAMLRDDKPFRAPGTMSPATG